MTVLLVGLGIVAVSGVAAWVARGSERLSSLIGAAGAVTGSLVAMTGTAGTLVSGVTARLTVPWALPMASFSIEVDALSAFFLTIVLGLSLLTALYGWEYLRPISPAGSSGKCSWLWFNTLVVSMALVVIARNGVLFLLAWEVMSLSSFFLVAFESDREQVRSSAWTYLVATHLGTALLLVMFLLIDAHTGSLDFAAWGDLKNAGPGLLGAIFLLGLIGFGVKAGMYPVHVWLPEAHPAAPSHVSALMSGVMIKTGIYAMVRLWSMMGPPEPWWGWLLLGIGVASGVMGVVFALAQHDIKRLLAYCSVENIGVISMGLGLGLLGWSYNQPFVMVAGFAGGLLHVVNHAVFKGLLFLATGSVVHSTGCREMEQMGGLMKRMPHTGAFFLTGSAAISGLPPLNGFVSEFIIYAAAFAAVLKGPVGLATPAIVAIGALALVGGLAAACFAKVFGMTFLGSPRSSQAADAHEVGPAMRVPKLILSACCFAIVFLAPWFTSGLFRLAASVSGAPTETWLAQMTPLATALTWVSAGSAAVLILLMLLAILRLALLRKRPVARTVTWDCGYAAPTPRMQYTASSFSQPITNLFRAVLGLRISSKLPTGLFPAAASFESHTGDTANEWLFRPSFRFVDKAMASLLWIQEGRVQIYVLYVAVTLLVLLLAAL
ncbi:MAG: proton-conducting transporter membrane subunit [bacterium]